MTATAPHSLIRLSLAAYWLLIGTMGIVSEMAAVRTGGTVGAGIGIDPERSAQLIHAFSGLDLALGLWTLSGWKARGAAAAQFLTVSLYTLGLTIAAPDIWLDPFGRLAKNIPILALIWVWWRQLPRRP